MFILPKNASIDAASFQYTPRFLISKLILRLRTHSLIDSMHQRLEPLNVPVLRHIAQPLDSRGLETDIRIETPGDSMVGDGLLLFLQQLDQLLLGRDCPQDASIRMIEKLYDGSLFVCRWNQ